MAIRELNQRELVEGGTVTMYYGFETSELYVEVKLPDEDFTLRARTGHEALDMFYHPFAYVN